MATVSMIDINFEWERDPKGNAFTLVARAERKSPYSSILGDEPAHQRVMWRQVSLSKYQPLKQFPSLFADFAKLQSSTQVLDFVNKFGPLTKEGLDPQKGESADTILESAKQMRSVSETLNRPRPSILNGGEPVAQGIAITASLVVDRKTKTPKVQLTLRDLRMGIWMQFAFAVSGGVALRTCDECGGLFPAGPGFDRRSDARFCSDEHRIHYNSLKRSAR